MHRRRPRSMSRELIPPSRRLCSPLPAAVAMQNAPSVADASPLGHRNFVFDEESPESVRTIQLVLWKHCCLNGCREDDVDRFQGE